MIKCIEKYCKNVMKKKHFIVSRSKYEQRL